MSKEMPVAEKPKKDDEEKPSEEARKYTLDTKTGQVISEKEAEERRQRRLEGSED